jgi:hypothetical protein
LNKLGALNNKIISMLPTAKGVPETPDQLDYLKIYISALTEEAYALAVDLILLDETNFIEALTKDQLGRLKLSDEERQNLKNIEADLNKTSGDQLKVAQQKRAAAFRTQMERIYELHLAAVKEANDRIDQIDAKDSAGKKVRERFLSDLRNAEAYAQYRHAQALEEDDEKFLKKCESARNKLHEAYAVHQNEYTILLNLGLIYGDPRCDPENKYIEFARQFFKQSIAIKPLDYYGHQQLASLAIREAYTWGLEFTKPEIINDAAKSAETARELRPGSGTIFALLAQAYILKWATTSDDNSRKELDPLIETALVQAAKGKASPVHQATARAQWLLQQSRRANDDQFKILKPQLAAALDNAIQEATVDRSWYGRQLLKDGNALKKALSDLEDKMRSTLRWPN